MVFVLELGLVESSEQLVAKISTSQCAQAVVLPVWTSDRKKGISSGIFKHWFQPIYCCFYMFLGPLGTDQAVPDVATDVLLADSPAQKINDADKADKQSMQKYRFIICIFLRKHANLFIENSYWVSLFFSYSFSQGQL